MSEDMQTNKLEKTKVTGLGNNFELLVGGVCIIIALVVVYRNYFGLTEDIFASNLVMMINLIVGLFLFNAGLRRYRFMKKYNRYVDILNNAPDLNLKTLAEQVGVPLKTIVEEFGSILRMKILQGAYVDHSTGYLVLSKTHDYKFMRTAPSQTTAKLNTKDITCDECGTVNQIEDGFMAQCGKCGHVLIDD